MTDVFVVTFSDLRFTIYEVYGVVEEFGPGYVLGVSGCRLKLLLGCRMNEVGTKACRRYARWVAWDFNPRLKMNTDFQPRRRNIIEGRKMNAEEVLGHSRIKSPLVWISTLPLLSRRSKNEKP